MSPRIRFCVTLSLLLVAAGFGPSAYAENTYRSSEHGFTISFPAKPHVDEREVPLASGPARLVRLNARHSDLRTALNVVAFSRAPFTPREVAYGLAQSRDRQVAQAKGTLVSDVDIDLQGHPGKEVIIAFGPPEKNFHYRVRTYYVANRQFLVSVVGTATVVKSGEADAYFRSFSLIE